MRNYFITLLFLITYLNVAQGQDPLLTILKEELKTEMEGLSKEVQKPYYISYRVEETTNNVIVASHGALMKSESVPRRMLTAQVRVGDYSMDNFNVTSGGKTPPARPVMLPMENNELSIKNSLWSITASEYNSALRDYSRIKSSLTTQLQSDDKSGDYTKGVPYSYYEKPLSKNQTQFDAKEWEKRAKNLSALFKAHTEIEEASVSVTFQTIRNYFVSTEGVDVVENLSYAHISINATTKANDGMVLPLYKSYFAYTPAGFPSEREMAKDVAVMVTKLKALRVAPVVEPYAGPAILNGESSGVFFHEIFGHRIEAQPMKSSQNGQTFKNMLGQLVLPADMSVCDDPTARRYLGRDLNGYYKHDEEGVKAEKVNVVESGVLRNFLTTKVPIEGFPKSNGHARAQSGFHATSRQSNLIIESKNRCTETELRKMLIEEAKKQGKEFGFYMAAVTGGFTTTGRQSPNSFNVTPTEVYRVYVDGRPDELVRGVDLVGTPLSMFSFISTAGGESGIFTGMCGAESGQVPVTAISPALFITKIEFQRKGKSNNTFPILPRPY